MNFSNCISSSSLAYIGGGGKGGDGAGGRSPPPPSGVISDFAWGGRRPNLELKLLSRRRREKIFRFFLGKRSIFHQILIVLLEFFVKIVLKMTIFDNLLVMSPPPKAVFGGLGGEGGERLLGGGAAPPSPP